MRSPRSRLETPPVVSPDGTPRRAARPNIFAAGNAAVSRLMAQRAPDTAAAHRMLSDGSTGADVSDLQTRLNAALPGATPLLVDGIFGPITKAAVISYQGQHGLVTDGIVGPITWGVLDTPVTPVPPVLPTLAPGSTGTDVAEAQQKLNVAVAPILDINGVYDGMTVAAVFAFQVLHNITATGILDSATRNALNTAVPGGGVDAAGVENAVDATGGAHALGTQVAGTSLHPVVGPIPMTFTGPAVLEAQRKLNIWNQTQPTPAAPLPENSTWDNAMLALVNAFQTAHSLPNGSLDVATWNALDLAAPAATSGFEQREWTEVVGGHTYTMTGVSASRYSWSFDAVGATGNVMNVTAKVNFTGNPPSPAWAGFVSSAWNLYAAQNASTNEKVNIDFALGQGSGSDSHAVVVHTGTNRADAGNWYLGDANAASTIPHEYGHLIGLSDEYQLHPGDYRTVTGHEPEVGDATGPPGIPAATMAANIQTQMMTLIAANVASVSTGLGLKMGAYAQQVLAAYAALPAVTLPAIAVVAPSGGNPGDPGRPAMTTTGQLVEDLDVGIRDDAALSRYDLIQALTYSSGSLMGDSSRVPDHDHGTPQPRHVQEFCDHIAQIRGGSWTVVTR